MTRLLHRPGSLLFDHLNNVSRLTEERLRASLSNPAPDLILLARITGLCHDLGKGTSYFQRYIADSGMQDYRWTLSFRWELAHHSRLGAEAAAFILQRRFGSESPLSLLAYGAILRHHSALGNLSEELHSQRRREKRDDLLEQLSELDDGLNELFSELFGTVDFAEFISNDSVFSESASSLRRSREEKQFDFFMLQRLLYSCLLWADRADASDTAELRVNQNPPGMVAEYRAEKSINESTTVLGSLRNRASSDVVKNLKKVGKKGNLFTLTLPTGLGNTLIGLEAALRLRERRELSGGIIHCLPFTSSTDQNVEVYKDVLRSAGLEVTGDRLLAHHQQVETSYTRSGEDGEFDSDEGKLFMEGWESDLVVTSFVQLGLTLFANHNRALRRLHRLANAVVILDEAQNLPTRYWLILREMMMYLSKTIGTHWILMPATQPAIFTRKDEARELVPKSEEYFSQLNRYRITKDSATDLTPVELAEVIVNNHSGRRVLAIVNTVDCAQALYREIKKHEADRALYFLSSEVIPKHRLARIREIKESKEPLICVSTPLIEAGVELDFDVVYRDLAPLDSLIQAAGCCNRHDSTDEGKVVLVRLRDEASGGYYADYSYDRGLLNAVEVLIADKSELDESSLYGIAKTYFRRVGETTSSDDSRKLLQYARNLDHERLANSFKLTEKEHYKEDRFVFVDEAAQQVWDRYSDFMSSSLEEKERRAEWGKLKPQLTDYTISVPSKSYPNSGPAEILLIQKDRYDEEIGFIRR